MNIEENQYNVTMSDSEEVSNFTPLPSHQNPKQKGGFLLFFIPFLVVLVAVLSLVSYLLLSKKPQTTTTPAEGQMSISCQVADGNTAYGWLVYYQFTNEDECNSCANNRETCLLPKVGELNRCQSGTGSQCVAAGQCTGRGCAVSSNLPACSIVQLDCVNAPYNGPGSTGNIINGRTGSNCSCPGPTATPTPPSNTPTPTPTTVTTTPTPTPTVTLTPTPGTTSTPGPSATPTPGPSATPTTGPSATPTPVPPTIPQTGESRMWYLIPAGIILLGLFL